MWKLLFFIIVPFKLLGETADTIFVRDISSPVETVRVVETVAETVKIASTESGITSQVAHPVKIAKIYKVQVGAFKNKENADNFYKTLEPIYGNVVYIENIPPYRKIRIGEYNSWKESIPIREELINKGYSDAWIVRPEK